MTEEAPLPPVRTSLKWASVDLDQTLAEGIWSPDDPTRRIGPPIEANVSKLKALVQAGWKIAIYTARSWGDYETIELWLDFHRIPYQRIICGKLLAGLYVDDRGINADEENWGEGRQP